MRYLTIIPNYTGSCITEDFKGEVVLSTLDLPIDFIKEIEEWHLRYRKIIPLNEQQRKAQMLEIEILDVQGIYLSKRLEELISEETKVKYFSEGKLKYLDND